MAGRRADPRPVGERGGAGLEALQAEPAGQLALAAVVLVAAVGLAGVLSQWQAAVASEQKAKENAAQAQEKAQEATNERDEARRQREEVKAVNEKLNRALILRTSIWPSTHGTQAAQSGWKSYWSNTVPSRERRTSAASNGTISIGSATRNCST